jgi:hypothetical protein
MFLSISNSFFNCFLLEPLRRSERQNFGHPMQKPNNAVECPTSLRIVANTSIVTLGAEHLFRHSKVAASKES